MHTASRLAIVVAAASLAQGCGGGSVPPAEPTRESKAPVVTTAGSVGAPAQGPVTKLSRASVKATIAQGLGVILQHVEFDEHPVFVEGKFHGHRIALLKNGLVGQGLKIGDVITSVNHMPIERPEQAYEAFKSLERARELRITYERDGEPHELVLPIED
jgi:type II secretory pathway component PulC